MPNPPKNAENRKRKYHIMTDQERFAHYSEMIREKYPGPEDEDFVKFASEYTRSTEEIEAGLNNGAKKKPVLITGTPKEIYRQIFEALSYVSRQLPFFLIPGEEYMSYESESQAESDDRAEYETYIKETNPEFDLNTTLTVDISVPNMATVSQQLGLKTDVIGSKGIFITQAFNACHDEILNGRLKAMWKREKAPVEAEAVQANSRPEKQVKEEAPQVKEEEKQVKEEEKQVSSMNKAEEPKRNAKIKYDWNAMEPIMPPPPPLRENKEFRPFYSGYMNSKEEIQAAAKNGEMKKPVFLTGTPKEIYTWLYDQMNLAAEEFVLHALPTPEHGDEGYEGYEHFLKRTNPGFDTKTRCTIEISSENMGEEICRRLGFGKKECEWEKNCLTKYLNRNHDELLINRLEEMWTKEKEEKSKPLPEQITDAKNKLKNGEFVDLQSIAMNGGTKGQVLATVVADGALNEVDRAPDMQTVLDSLKQTEGFLFMNASKEYRDLRKKLEDVIRIGKEIANPQKGAQKGAEPLSVQLENAYAALDDAAKTYLSVKTKRLGDRADAGSPDVRGTKRYNIIASLRTITNPVTRAEVKKKFGAKLDHPQSENSAHNQPDVRQSEAKRKGSALIS